MSHFRLALMALCFGSGAATLPRAQPYPSRPIQLVVPFSPGTSPDIIGRGLAAGLSAELGQPVVVVDREGASGAIGYASVANAVSDGYTLAFGPQGPLTVLPNVKADLTYSLESFAPICQVFEDIFALVVGPNSTIADFNDLVARARGKQRSLTFGSPGIATMPHFQVEGLELAAGIKLNHAPYRMVSQMIQDVVGGNIDLAVTSIQAMRASNARILAILKTTPSPLFPSAPLIGQFGYNVSQTSLGGLYAPKGVPQAIRDRLEAACAKTFAGSDFQRLEADASIAPVFLGATEFGKRLSQDRHDKAELIKKLGITIE